MNSVKFRGHYSSRENLNDKNNTQYIHTSKCIDCHENMFSVRLSKKN